MINSFFGTFNSWYSFWHKFYDENFGIASSEIAHVVMTDDGGKHWRNVKIAYTKPNDGHSYMVYSIQIPSYTTAYVILDHTYIYKYTRDFTDEVEEKIVQERGGQYREV